MTRNPALAPTARSTRLTTGIALAVAACVAVSLVLEALRVPYLADDWWLIGAFDQNGYRETLRSIVVGDDSAATGRFYRPVWRMTFALDALLGAHAWLSHAANLALHGACSFALLRLASQLGLGRSSARWVALLFLIHPAGYQPATWIAARGDSLALLFALASLSALFEGRSRTTLVLLALGMFSKEAAFVALPVALGLLLSGRGPADPRSRVRLALGVLVLGVAVLVLRWSRLNDPFGGYSAELALFSMPLGLVFTKWAETAALTCMPWEVGPVLRVGFGVLLAVLACAAARESRKSRLALIVGASLFLLSLLALHGLGADSYLGANGRFTYGPMAGLALLLGGVLGAAGPRLGASVGLGLLLLYGSMGWSVHRAGAAALDEVLPRLELVRELASASSGPTAVVGLQQQAGPHWVAPYLATFGLSAPFLEPGAQHPFVLISAEDHARGRLPREVFGSLGVPGTAMVALDDAFLGPSSSPNVGPGLRFDVPGDLLEIDLGEAPGLLRLLGAPTGDPVVPLGFGDAGSLALDNPTLVLERECAAGLTEVQDFAQQFGMPGRFTLQAVSYRAGRVSFGPSLEIEIAGR